MLPSKTTTSQTSKKCCSYIREDLHSYLKEFTCQQPKSDPATLATIKHHIENNTIILFVKPGCGFCERTKTLFKQHYPTTPFHTVIGSTKAMRIGLAHALGISAVSFPTIWIQGVYVGGADATASLHSRNELTSMISNQRIEMAPFGTGLIKTKPVFMTQLAGSHARLETDGPCDSSTSKWYCFQTKSYAQVIRMMSFLHILIMVIALIGGESNSLIGMYITTAVGLVLLVDLVLFTTFGATPLTIFGNISTWLVWNTKGDAVPNIPYKVVFFVYILGFGSFFSTCSSYSDPLTCWQNNTLEFRGGIIGSIVNSSMLAVFRF